MQTLKAQLEKSSYTLCLRQIVDPCPNFQDAVRAVKRELDITEGAATLAVIQSGPKGKKLYNEFCRQGRPQTL
jgi:hypothetical protein